MVVAMDSCFAHSGTHQYGIVSQTSVRTKVFLEASLLPRRVQSTALNANSTVDRWYLAVGWEQFSHGVRMEMGSEKLSCVPKKVCNTT